MTTNGRLSPFVRREINDIMDEVHPGDMNMDELCDLLKLMTAIRQRVRASKVSPVQPANDRPRLSVVRVGNHQDEGGQR